MNRKFIYGAAVAIALVAMMGAANWKSYVDENILTGTNTGTLVTTNLATGGSKSFYSHVKVHNQSASVWFGIALITQQDTGSAHTTYATMTYLVPPDSTLSIDNRELSSIKHITDGSGNVAWVIERHYEN